MSAVNPGIASAGNRSNQEMQLKHGTHNMTRLRATKLAIIGSALCWAPTAMAQSVVQTEAGAVRGTSADGLNIFLGVPFAQPPIGDLRWRAPQPVKRWSGTRDARQFAAACTQEASAPSSPSTSPWGPAFLNASERSEDCLYLNIWTPAKRAAKRPVYVFIHGGAYQAGGTNIAAQQGAGLARRGAVVVTLQYRLGTLGFFAHPDLTKESPLRTSGNYGVLDAIEALRWVRANIAKFGGDPRNVTVAGQSAGSGVVNALLFSPLAKGSFDRAVLESGPALGIPPFPLAVAEAAGVATAAKAKKDLAGLRAIPAADIKTVAPATIPLPILDGKVIPVNPESPASPIISKVPVIIGYTRDESPAADGPQTVTAFEAEVKKRFGALADRVLKLYPHANDAEAARSGAQLNRDRRVAGLILWAERRKAEGVPVYAYHFERVFPGGNPDRFGAFHSSEIPYVLGAMSLPGVNFTARDRQISGAMQDRWLNFMRTGNPNSAKGNVQWPQTTLDPASIWRIDPADSAPLLDAERLALFREYQAKGGSLGLF